MLPVVGWYLAAANRDAAFVAPMLQGWAQDDELRDDLFGDVLHQHGAALMALMACRNVDAITLLVEAALPRPDMDSNTNSIPLEALAVLTAEGFFERDRFDDLVRQCIVRFTPMEDASGRRQWLASVLCDMGLGSFAEEFRGWFDKEMMDMPGMDVIDRDWMEQSIARGLFTQYPEWHARKSFHAIAEDVMVGMEWMIGRPEAGASSYFGGDDDGVMDDGYAPLVPVRAAPKIGRNDPCPCASGKKYKKCHGRTGGVD